MDIDLARARAEKLFRQEEQQREGKAALAEYEAKAMAVRENMARLKALRLAKETRANKAVPDRTVPGPKRRA
jgi:hypothetical protein